MGYKNREIEVKVLVADKYKSVVQSVNNFFEKNNFTFSTTKGKSGDLYWKAPKSGDASFVRLRRVSNNSNDGQITVKSQDKGNNIDRIEVDLYVSDYKQAKTLMLNLFGEPMAEVCKEYMVFFLEDEHTNISVYRVVGDERTFVEIEAKSKSRVKEILVDAIDIFGESEMRWVQSSVYNMFVEKKDPKVKPISGAIESLNE